jgi:hypothetical protein
MRRGLTTNNAKVFFELSGFFAGMNREHDHEAFYATFFD